MDLYLDPMAIRRVLADNIERLMRYAADRHGEYPSQYALAPAINVSQSSLSRIMARKQEAGIEIVEAIASAYGLQAWQLLTPDLDPANPPVVLITDAEKMLYKRMQEVADQYDRLRGQDVASESEPGAARANSDRPRPGKGKASHRGR